MPNRCENRLLNALHANDLALLNRNLSPIELVDRLHIEAPNRDVEQIVFPISGLISIVTTSGRERKKVEVGLVGREGMTGLAVLCGAGRSPNETYVQMPGNGMVISADHFRAAIAESATLIATLQLFAHVFSVQVTQTAAANAHGKLEERLCRWLLMAHDRGEGDDLALTHEYIGIMLGVRRAGVTICVQTLQSQGLIESDRGNIRVTDRKGLAEIANGFYGVPESEYKRLF